MQYLKLLRVNNYIKNLIIFFPIFFTPDKFEPNSFYKLLISFFIFSFCTSSVYIFNDILDVESDKIHKIKKNRPIASGKIKIHQASYIAIALLILSTASSFFLSEFFFYLMLTYLGINILYNFLLKHILFVDVLILSFVYVIRIFIGSDIVDINPSSWMIGLIYLSALFLFLCKRKDHVKQKKNFLYNEKILNFLIIISSITIIIFYNIYIFSDYAFIENSKLYFSSIFVIFGLVRYLKIILNSENKIFDPTEIILKDRILFINLLIWIIYFIVIVYE